MDELRDLLRRHTEIRVGFPRVDWNGLRAELGPRVDDEVVRQQLTTLWLRAVAAHFGERAEITFDGAFACVAMPACEETQRAARFAELHHARVLRQLPDIAKPLARPLPLLMFGAFEDFVSYHADFDPDEGEMATAGGVFIDEGEPHIALPALDGELEETLAHELTHALVQHLPLPFWANEGLACSLQWTALAGASSATLHTASRELIARQRAFWNEDNIHLFWTGAGFRDVEAQELSYYLAHNCVQILGGDYSALVRFANSARHEDAGEAASRSVYGRSLGDLVAVVLGPGNWSPKPGDASR